MRDLGHLMKQNKHDRNSRRNANYKTLKPGKLMPTVLRNTIDYSTEQKRFPTLKSINGKPLGTQNVQEFTVTKDDDDFSRDCLDLSVRIGGGDVLSDMLSPASLTSPTSPRRLKRIDGKTNRSSLEDLNSTSRRTLGSKVKQKHHIKIPKRKKDARMVSQELSYQSMPAYQEMRNRVLK